MKNIFAVIFSFILFFPAFAKAQLSITLKTGQLYSFSKIINKNNNPSPYFSVSPYISTGFMGVNFGYEYDKYSFEVGWEYTEVGMQTRERTLTTLCPDCYDLQGRIFDDYYGVPIHTFPVRIGYQFFSSKHLDLFAKLGYFQVSRKDDKTGFGNAGFFGPFANKDFYYSAPAGIPFSKISYNLQADFNLVYNIGKQKKHAISLDLIYNQGLKKLAEDHFITKIYKIGQNFDNYTSRRGSFAGFNIGYKRIFQDSKPKIKHKKKKPKIPYCIE
jgi:hypothetical protein